MFRLHYFLSKSERRPSRYFVLCLVFFVIGFALAFSSVDISPFVFIHETGHSLTADMLDVRLEKTSRNSYLMYLEKEAPLRRYVRVLKAGYKAELMLWYLFAAVLFVVNIRRIRRFKNGVHFLLALFPGYAAGLFSKMKGTTDIQAISELLGTGELAVLRRFIFLETLGMVLVLAAYVSGFYLYLRGREKADTLK